MAARKNVLFIVIDQLRADVVDGALAAHVPTPNLDAFAAGAFGFRNHFSVTAPCGPARASLLTGLYAMNHRAIRNGTPLAGHHGNVALEVRKLGYEPLLFGYTDAQPDPHERHPADPDNLVYENVMRGFREVVEMRLEAGAEWPAFLRAEGYEVPDAMAADMWSLYRPEGGAFGGPALYRAEHSDTAYLTDETIKALSIRNNRPWFAHLAYIRPHPPFVAPAPYHRLIDPHGLPTPRSSGFAHPFRDAWFSDRSNQGMFWGFDGDCAGLDAGEAALARATYLGLVAEVDHHLGRLFGWLEASGQADNTLVVITADHGEMLGDQGYWGKDNVLDPVFRVPLMIRAPGLPPGESGAITESVDVVPTILEWLGGDAPAAMDGASLMPFLHGETPETWRQAAMLETEFGEPGAPTRFETHFKLPPQRTRAAILRERDWKYVHFAGGVPPLLFDLRNDPEETENRAALPECAPELGRLRAALLSRRMESAHRPYG